MPIITVGNTKGGVGKTAMTVQIAAALTLAGNRVIVFDGDTKQHTAAIALQMRETVGAPPIAVSSHPDGKSLLTQVRLQSPLYDYTVIDVGGRDSGALRAALGVTDILVVPFSPGSFELWAYDQVYEVIQEMLPIHEFKVMPFLNKAHPAGQEADNMAVVDQVSAYGFPVYSERVQNRVAVERASSRGITVGEFKPLNPMAHSEVSAILQAIHDTLDGTYQFKPKATDDAYPSNV